MSHDDKDYAKQIVEEEGGQIVSTGHHVIKEGFIMATGDASVDASGATNVYVFDGAEAEVRDEVTLFAGDNATIYARGNAEISANDNSTVEARGKAGVKAFDSSKIKAYGEVTVYARDKSEVDAYESARIEAFGGAVIRNHSTEAQIRSHSDTVTVIHDDR